MSQSYRRLYCKLAVSGESRGEHDDKRLSNRIIRRANKVKLRTEKDPEFRDKRSIEVYKFAGDGKTEVDIDNPGNFHVKRLTRGKVRMIK